MLRNSHGVGIAPPAADRDELDGGMTKMKGITGMRELEEHRHKAGSSKTTRGPVVLLPGPLA